MKNLIFLMAAALLLMGCAQNRGADNPIVGCDLKYQSSELKYIGKSADECSRMRFACERNAEYFQDECGCGCKIKDNAVSERSKNYCTQEQREGDVCIALYAPVCGWFDPEKIQCIKHPCAQTFGNSCGACQDERVFYWTEGECI